jgi:hypothetical protein
MKDLKLYLFKRMMQDNPEIFMKSLEEIETKMIEMQKEIDDLNKKIKFPLTSR